MTAAVAFVRDPVGAFVDFSAIPFLIFLGLGAGKRVLDGMIIPRQAEGVSDLAELSTLWMGYVWLSNFSGGWVIQSLDDGDIINVLTLVLVGCFAVLFGKRAGPFIP